MPRGACAGACSRGLSRNRGELSPENPAREADRISRKRKRRRIYYPPTLPESGSRDARFRILSLGTGCRDDFFGGRTLLCRCFGAPHSSSCLPAFFAKGISTAYAEWVSHGGRWFRRCSVFSENGCHAVVGIGPPYRAFRKTGDASFSQEAFRLSVPE